MSTVYLLHFTSPLAHARHYIGTARDLNKRLECHQKGTGARLMAVLHEKGIEWCLARTWAGGRKLERRLKNLHNAPQLCPICNPTHWVTNGAITCHFGDDAAEDDLTTQLESGGSS